jgi:hypothetical protein
VGGARERLRAADARPGRRADRRSARGPVLPYARDLTALHERLLAAAVGAGEIEDGTPGPRREMQVADPDGYCLMIAEIEVERVRFNDH